MGAGSPINMMSISRPGRPGVWFVLGLCACLPTAALGSSAWVGSSRGGGSSSSGRALAFGYALPPFYPPGAPSPVEERPFDEAVAAARQSPARRIERYPAFPETPTALAHEVSGG